MKQIKEKILGTAIDLFNQRGVGNVRVKDIADAASISPGNLTYHYKTKKELMEAVYQYMLTALQEIDTKDATFVEAIDVLEIARTYLNFQIRFRFFYRDTLEIMRLQPEIKVAYQKQVHQIISFNNHIIILLFQAGYLIEEPHPEHYASLAKNAWAIQNSWMSEREILGDDLNDVEKGLHAGLDLFFPYFTEKGKEFYFEMKENMEEWIKKDPAKIQQS